MPDHPLTDSLTFSRRVIAAGRAPFTVCRLGRAVRDILADHPSLTAISYEFRSERNVIHALMPMTAWCTDRSGIPQMLTARAMSRELLESLWKLQELAPTVLSRDAYERHIGRLRDGFHGNILHMRQASFISWSDLEGGIDLLSGAAQAPSGQIPAADEVYGIAIIDRAESAHTRLDQTSLVREAIGWHDRLLGAFLDRPVRSTPDFLPVKQT